MHELRTTSTRVPIVVKFIATFMHGLFATVGLSILAVVCASALLDPGDAFQRWGRSPTGEEMRAGRIWFDAPIKAIVPINKGETDRIPASGDPWNGCHLERQRYQQTGKSASWVNQRVYAYGAASVEAEGRTHVVPLYSVWMPDTAGVVLEESVARSLMGNDFAAQDLSGIERRTAEHGRVRYVQKCARPGQWLFFDGAVVDGTYRPTAADVSVGPTLTSRRLSFLNLRLVGASTGVAVFFYVTGMTLLWGAPFALSALFRRRGALQKAGAFSWLTFVLASLALVLGAFFVGVLVKAPAATALPAVFASLLLGAAAFFRARRRALVGFLSRELHEARVQGAEGEVQSPLTNVPVAQWVLEVFRIGAKNSQVKVGTLESGNLVRVHFAGNPEGPGEIDTREAIVDFPAADIARGGMDIPQHIVRSLPGFDVTSRYRLRESVLPIGSTVVVRGTREKQPLRHAEDAAGDLGYRAPTFQTLVRGSEAEPLVLVEGTREALAGRIARDATLLRVATVIAAVGAAASLGFVGLAVALASGVH
jgi:hypothetical protein